MAIKRHVVYMATTADRYELPIAVADTHQELDRLLGKRKNYTLTTICHDRQRNKKDFDGDDGRHHVRVFKVEV